MPLLTWSKAARSLFPQSKGATLLLAGEPGARMLALDVAAVALTGGGDVLWIEAANRVDLSALTETAQRWGLSPQPLVRRLHVARAFTLDQPGTLCTASLDAGLWKHPVALRSSPSRWPSAGMRKSPGKTRAASPDASPEASGRSGRAGTGS